MLLPLIKAASPAAAVSSASSSAVGAGTPRVLTLGQRVLMVRHRLDEDPSFARAGAIGEGLVGCLHAGAFDGVGKVAVDVGDMG